MFYRRVIQRSIDELASVLSREQLALLVARLNMASGVQISAEWEAMVLAALARTASVRHEHDSGGTSRPDIRAVVADLGLEFVADIATVSDADMEDDNPVEHFRKEMFRVARTLGLTGAGLFLHVERLEGIESNERRLLALPPKGEIPQFIRQHVAPFLRQVADDPRSDRRLVHDDAVANFRLEYSAQEKAISGGGWPIYTNARSVRHNPLFRSLEQKARQLRNAGFVGPKGVIMCDGGCDGMGANPQRIVAAFFRQHRRTVSFVALLDIPDSAGPVLKPRMRVCWNRTLTPSQSADIEEALTRMVRQLPAPFRASQYARHRSYRPDFRSHHSREGAYMIDSHGSREVIRVSARAVLRALAGDIRHRPELFPNADYSVPIRIFQAQVNEGRSIRAIRLERSDSDDDDWVVIEFDGPDAAVAPFHAPSAPTEG